MTYSFKFWKRWNHESRHMYKTLTAACFACIIVISTNIFIIQKFIKHLPTTVLAILEIVLVLSILLALILAAILKRRDLLSVYMVSAFIYSQYRVIIAVTAVLIAIFPQTYLLALSSQQYSRSQGPLCCADSVDISLFCKHPSMDSANVITIPCYHVSFLFTTI
ncbi:putative integral membrane protein [Brugia pahangi]